MRFCELAEGVDELTWDHHRRRGEYSAWLREMIKDPELAQEVGAIETSVGPTPGEARQSGRRRLQRPQRDSNPRFQDENLMSWT